MTQLFPHQNQKLKEMKKVYKKHTLHFRDLSSWNHKTLGISFSCTGANQSG